MGEIEVLADLRAVLAESPLYDRDSHRLYVADIRGRRLHLLDLSGGPRRSFALPDEPGAFALLPDGAGALLALRTGLFALDFASGDLDRLAEPPFDPQVMRFNEGAVAPDGRFYVGVMFDPRPGVEAARFEAPAHSFTLDGGLRAEADVSDLHNGMGFSPDGRTFYISHTHARAIFAYALNPLTGRLSDRRLFAEVEPGVGSPDGAAVDAEGGYWCALHRGARLRRYAPDGRVDREIPLPVSRPTMPAFYGKDLRILALTCASEGLDAEARRAEPWAGDVLTLDPGVTGLARRCRLAPPRA